MPVVRISDDLFARLQRHATPLVDSVSDVLERVLYAYENAAGATPSLQPKKQNTADALPGNDYPSLWNSVTSKFNALSPRYPVRSGGSGAPFRKVLIDNPEIHYEWNLRKREGFLDVCLHFEATSQTVNLKRIEPVGAATTSICSGVDQPFDAAPWGEKWAQARFRVKLSGKWPNNDETSEAAELMNLLIERTHELI